MTFAKLSFAALVLGASLTPAFAEGGEHIQSSTSVYLQSLGQSNGAPVVEGRQAAPISAPATLTDAERYVIVHNSASNN